ncbi:FabD/lysophospholipase-like protein, partial [Wilcoxina mikolae CBS 423.85]
MSPDGRGLRLLSLDGGGIRGVSELLILHELMVRIQHKQKMPELPRPHMYFDIIGGTSTGGLIAIMLGRLRMSTEEAITAYADLAKYIFKDKKFKMQDGLFKATRLEEAIQKIVKNYGEHGNPEEEMLDTRADNVCKTFVCAVAAQHIGSPTIFRSYKVPRADINCKIWEAARATSAAPTFFKRIKIGEKNAQVHFVDAALGCNNPVRQVLNEAALACENVPVDCILSVGTGKPQTVGLPEPDAFQKLLPTKIIEVLKKLATDSDRVAEEMEQQYKNIPGIYFRLNVEQGMQGITLEEWKKLG